MSDTIVLIYHVTVFNRELSDVKGDAQFSKDQYVLAMYLVEQARSGRPLPARLPDELVPPSLRAKLLAAAAAAWQPGAAPGSQVPPSVATAAGPQATSPSTPKPQPQPAAQLPSATPVGTAMLTPVDGIGPGVAATGATRALMSQLETQMANEMAAYQQAVCALQRAQAQTDAIVGILLLEKKRMPEPRCLRLHLNVYMLHLMLKVI